MSSIDKLQILGVRSFDNKKAEIIKFFNPLTLIVGLNGSGKTTIIECLRYATTGELPPNSGQGGAWIHDPKLCNETEVLAQVKVSFNSTSGTRMVLSRNLQLTVKKTTRAQKALDGTLMMVKNGERTTISTRVAELDTVIPQYLGVSKAILESVIFCHQDDSLWPMSTPALLKKKFDEIFEALKYTKAVENIKLIRKTQMAEHDKFKIHEQHAKEDKDKGARAEKKMLALSDEIDELRAQQEGLKDKIKDAADKCNEAYDKSAQFERIVVELGGKRIEAASATRNINSLQQNMTRMTDTDEELRTMLDQYEERLALNEKDKESHMHTYRELIKALQDNRDKLGTKQGEEGRFKAQKDQYERQIESRKQLVKDTARRHGVRGFDVDITDDHVRDFMERIGKMARDQQNEFERARKKTQEETQQSQQELTTLNSQRSALMQTKSSANSYIQINDGKILRFQIDLDKIDVDEGGKVVLESNLENVITRLGNAKTGLQASDWDSKMSSAEANMRSLDAQKDNFDSELLEASRNAKDSARLDLLHKDLKDRQQSLEAMSGAHGTRIGELLGNDWTPSNLDQKYQDVLAEKSSSVKEAELLRDGTSRELEHVKYQFSTASNNLQQKQSDLLKNEKAVNECSDLDTYDPVDYLTFVENLEKDILESRSNQVSYEAMLGYWQKCKEAYETDQTCNLCDRGFTAREAKEQSRFSEKLNKRLAKAMKNVNVEALEEDEQDLAKARAARPSYDACVRLRREIPGIESECKSLQGRLDTLNQQLEQHDDTIRTRGTSKREIDSILKTVQNITKYNTDIGNFEEQITQLAVVQKAAGMSRGLEKIQADQKAITDQIRSAAANIQQLRSDRDRARSQINALEFEVRDVREKLSGAVHQLKEKMSLQRQIEDLKAQNSEQRDAIKTADQEIQNLIPKLSLVQAKLEDIRNRGNERDRELQKEAGKLTDSANQLRIAEQDINGYLDRGGPQQLARATREIQNINEEITGIEEEQRQVTKEIKKLETELSNHGATKRAINDNLSFRESVQHLQTLEREIDELQKHNAEDDKVKYEREAAKWQNMRNKLSAEMATIVGTLKSKDDQLQQLMEEYDTDFKDAKANYRKAHIQTIVTKAAIEDLGRYGGALDKAIMKYHSLKMEEINRIIDELWRSTYQGTDVDTVMIRSENETQKGNKSYNYRVVMIKQDAEMDMRGRCSAGQKVLASIIIRLALAECFGVRCGLIALDEPTTNLDQENIRALAQSLSEIIRVRRQQANFQLIVITHDEEFLRHMNSADYVDYYYRVSRDQNQCSQIFKQSIQAVLQGH